MQESAGVRRPRAVIRELNANTNLQQRYKARKIANSDCYVVVPAAPGLVPQPGDVRYFVRAILRRLYQLQRQDEEADDADTPLWSLNDGDHRIAFLQDMRGTCIPLRNATSTIINTMRGCKGLRLETAFAVHTLLALALDSDLLRTVAGDPDREADLVASLADFAVVYGEWYEQCHHRHGDPVPRFPTFVCVVLKVRSVVIPAVDVALLRPAVLPQMQCFQVWLHWHH